jgi:predicted MFS family arabinose efflux permease
MARKWWTLTAVCTGVFMLLLDITIVNVALPDIERGFHATLSDLQWVIDAYALTLAAFLLTAGSLADLYGRRKLFAVGITVFTLGSLACGLATSSLFLVLARGAQGVGGAIMFATSLALLAQAFHGKDRGVAFGAFGAITGVAIAVGPVLGGVLTSGVSWAISASIFSALTFLVLYLQNILGLSAVETGIRFLPLTGAIFLTAGIAGRLTTRVPRRMLIAPGFLLVGGGMLLMRGLTSASGWTHLLPGMVLAGVGAGLVNVPLVSTAVGVVEPARAGMASGINSTLRQVGVATGVAALGSLFASQVRSSVITHLAGTPLAAHARVIAHGISNGGAAQAITTAPAPLRGLVGGAARVAAQSTALASSAASPAHCRSPTHRPRRGSTSWPRRSCSKRPLSTARC